MMVEVSVTSPPSTDASGKPRAAKGAATKVAPSRVLGSYGRVAAWLSKRVEVALGTVDLTLPQFRVLGILAEGSSAASGLADRLAVRRPSITAIVDGLVARGLVDRRQEDSDRRRVAVRLTPEGEQVLAAADKAVDEYLASLAGCLPSKEEAMALRSLELWGQAMAASREAPKTGEQVLSEGGDR
jgi:long-chain acyl-CoA synthetase